MTPFFGILYKKDIPDNRLDLEGMTNALIDWGHKPAEVVNVSRLVFGQFNTGKEYTTFWNASSSRMDNVFVMGTGRLDNRRALCEELNLPFSEDLSNNKIITEAYHKWGQNLSSRLLGDWAFMLWDEIKEKLFLARDQVGSSQLLFSDHDDFFVFSTLIQPLLKVPGLKIRHNPRYVSKTLLGVLEAGSETPYVNIFRLLNGQQLCFNEHKLKVIRYWSFDQVKKVYYKRDEEYLEAFTELYTNAVASRLSGAEKVGMWLSSGLDSSSILALLDEKVTEERIDSFTAVPLFQSDGWESEMSRYGNETSLVSLLATNFPRINAHYCDSAETTPFKAMQVAHEVLCHPIVTTNMHWMWSTLKQASERRVDRFFTGEGGNLTISYGGNPNPRRFDPQLLLRLLQRNDFRKNTSLRDAQAFFKLLLTPFIPKSILKSVSGLAETISPQRLGENFYLKPDLITEELLNNIRQNPHEVTHANLMTFDKGFDARAKILIRQGLTAGSIHHQIGSVLGLQICDPTMDLKLVEFCMGLPDDQFARLSRKRLLVRRAMNGRLPKEILWNKKRGVQSVDILQRLLLDKEQIRARISDLQTNQLVNQYVDTKRLWKKFEILSSQNSPSNFIQLTYWYVSLSTCIWLGNLES